MVRLGEMDEGFRLLDPVFKAAQAESLSRWKVDSDLDLLRADPRFKAILEQAEARLATSR